MPAKPRKNSQARVSLIPTSCRTYSSQLTLTPQGSTASSQEAWCRYSLSTSVPSKSNRTARMVGSMGSKCQCIRPRHGSRRLLARTVVMIGRHSSWHGSGESQVGYNHASPVVRALPIWILAACAWLAGCDRVEGPYPAREIKLIVQAAPGGTSDTVSRVIGSLAEGDLGVPIVCENKPGASGALAFSYVARRQPDGYTIGHAPVEIAIVRALGYADIGPSDLSLICLVSKTAPALVVRSDSPWQSFADFVSYAREEAGRIVMANSGIGSIWHFNILLMEQGTGARFTHLPYGGSTPALVTVIGGHADAAVAGVGEVVSHVKAGKLRALAVFDSSRSGVLQDVPTTHELGYAIGAPAWSGFFGPAGMTEQHVSVLADAFERAFGTAEWKKLCRERGMEALFLDKDEFASFAKEQQNFFESEIPKLVRLGSAG